MESKREAPDPEKLWYVGEYFDEEKGCWMPKLGSCDPLSSNPIYRTAGCAPTERQAVQFYIGTKTLLLREVNNQQRALMLALGSAKNMLEKL
jgi:hypothetical protein